MCKKILHPGILNANYQVLFLLYWLFIKSHLYLVFKIVFVEHLAEDDNLHTLKYLMCDMLFSINWVSLHARLNRHFVAWSFKNKKYKKIKAHRKSLQKEPTVKKCLLILKFI